MSDVFDYFKRLQDSMLEGFSKSFKQVNKRMSSKYRRPSCEISQGKDSLNIKINLPDMSKKDVILNVTHDYLEILAEKKGRKEKKSRRSYRMEEKYIGFRRVIPLPPGLVTDKARAKFLKGKLVVKIPKIRVGKIKVK